MANADDLEKTWGAIEKKIGNLIGKAEGLSGVKLEAVDKAITDILNDLNSLLGMVRTLNVGSQAVVLEYKSSFEAIRKAIADIKEEKEKNEDGLLETIKNLEDKYKLLVTAINEDRHRLKGEIKKLNFLLSQPRPYGAFLRIVDEKERRVDIDFDGHRKNVYVAEEIELKKLQVGQRLLLSPTGNVLSAPEEFEERGEEAVVDEVLSDGRVRVTSHFDEKQIVVQAGCLYDKGCKPLSVGETVRLDRKSGILLERTPRKETSELLVEEIPGITFDQIGGQDEALKKLRQLIEYPFLYPELFRKYHSTPPRGLLLYGSPGCGKTMSLKATANALKERLGKKVMLMTVRGPQLLTMWVGETERKIREPFELAKAKAKEGIFVIILFDELDAMFPIRGTHTGSAGVHETSVTQFSTMLDGIEEIPNIIVIGTTNRPDLIDPALTRPGRLYPPIEFPRPNQQGVTEILSIYLKPLAHLVHQKYIDPGHPGYEKRYAVFNKDRERVIRGYFIKRAIGLIFGEKQNIFGKGDEEDKSAIARFQDIEKQKVIAIEFLDTHASRSFYMKDLISGAIIVDAVKKMQLRGILAEIQKEEGGLRVSHLLDSLEEVFKEGEALPSRTDPSEWARILGIPISRPFRIIEQDKKEDTQTGAKRGRGNIV